MLPGNSLPLADEILMTQQRLLQLQMQLLAAAKRQVHEQFGQDTTHGMKQAVGMESIISCLPDSTTTPNLELKAGDLKSCLTSLMQ